MFKKSSYNWLMLNLVLMVLLEVLFSSDAKGGCWFPVQPIFSVEEFDDVNCKDMSSIDISDRPNLPATLTFNRETIWPQGDKMPPGCDPNEIMTNAMNPGLGVRALHQQGFTGAGVSVAIIDHDLFQDHPEFAGKVVAYHDLGEYETSMHGPAVASLLVGSNCGTAPDARLYYVSCSQTYDTNDYAEGLDWIVQQNESLPASEKIRIVSISAAPDRSLWTYREQYLQARDRAEAAGILVLDVTRFASVCWYDANDPENVAKCTPGFPGMEPFYPEEILVPSSPRTTAEEVYEGDFSYRYFGRGGISWSMPYCAGVLAMGWQIRPELTKEQMVDLLFQTAYVNDDGAQIINPPAFIYSLAPIKPFTNVTNDDLSGFDLSAWPDLIDTLTFNQDTIWPEPNKMPPGCDPNEIMTNAMNPGLGVRSLHQQGITGAGINVAIIDQPIIQTHPEYNGKIAAYYDAGCGGSETSMHGPAMTSLLVGENCGTAPGVNVYYAAVPSWHMDAAYCADALDWVVAQNETLPASEKIRVVSVSAQPSGLGSVYTNQEMWDAAVANAQSAGILVLDCTWHHGFVSLCWYDADDPENVSKCTPGFRDGPVEVDAGHIHAPTAPRTEAEVRSEGNYGYIYDGGSHRSSRPNAKNGYSGAIPYCAGVLAMGWQIRPELTGEQMVDLLFQTAYVNGDGAQIINPPAFINLLLENKPAIHLSDDKFSFSTVFGDPNPQVLSISNGGLGTLNWGISETCDWLEVEPNTGSSTGLSDVNDVTLSVTDLPPGIHNCELTVSDPCAINTPQTVEVTLYVIGGGDGDGEQRYVPSEYGTIQAAINDCNEGDIVVIEPGTYTGTDNTDLDFNGKAITVRSTKPDNPAVVAATIIDCNGSESEPHGGFYFHTYEDANSVLSGLTITGAYGGFGGAIKCYDSSPAIVNCVFVDNSVSGAGAGMHNHYSNPILINCIFRNNSSDWVGGALRNHTSSPVLINCLVTDNSAHYGGAMQNENSSSNPTLINCTFTGNTASGWAGGILVRDSIPVISNCIFWGNSDAGGTDESAQIHGGSPVINYSCIQGWTGGLGGTDNIGLNPLFVDLNNEDYHLKSEAGRWDPHSESWVIDDVTSPCIDAGDPASDWTAELWPHGKSINMGAYGGTPEASMSLSNTGNIADLNNSNSVDHTDLMMVTNEWPYQEVLLAEDLDRNGIVNFADFAIFANNWLWEE